MKKLLTLMLLALLPAMMLRAADKVVEIETTLGNIKVKLYEDTPRHTLNFVKLAEDGTYDGVLFHRVIKDFMVQTGDPVSKEETPSQPIGTGSVGEKIEAEIFFPAHYHKYGALAAARDGNPQKKSSGSQFYIVTGRKFDRATAEERVRKAMSKPVYDQMVRDNQAELKAIRGEGGVEAMRAKMAEYQRAAVEQVGELPQDIIDTYVTVGGTPHLDGDYTVFGEVIEGMDVVEKIQNVETGAQDRPVDDIRIISMKVLE